MFQRFRHFLYCIVFASCSMVLLSGIADAAQTTRQADVVVVGAGISGITAAYELKKSLPDATIQILEARNRSCGRVLTVELRSANGTGNWDLGGTWVGAAQTDLIELMRELQLRLTPQFISGTSVQPKEGSAGESVRFENDDSPDQLSDAHLIAFYFRLQNLSLHVDAADPFAGDELAALRWAAMSVDDYAERSGATADERAHLDSTVRTFLGASANETAMLFFLAFLNATGADMGSLAGIGPADAQGFRVVNGSARLCHAALDRLPADALVTDAPVASIQDDGRAVLVATTNGILVSASAVIVAVPPGRAAEIHFTPPLEDDKLAALRSFRSTDRWAKFVVTYARPFWRERGMSGYVSTGGVSAYDAVSPSGGAALAGFLHLRQTASAATSDERRADVLAELATQLGDDALDALDYADKLWGDDPWAAGGGCVASVPPHAMTPDWAALLREPVGRVYWAGTETASSWTMYMSGAVQSGKRAALQVMSRLAQRTRSEL